MITKGRRAFLGFAAASALAVTAAGADAETLLERGAYLTNSILACGNCHTPQDRGGPIAGMGHAGGTVFDEEPFTAYAPNITPDPKTGIGTWTDGQIGKAIREGVRPDGSIIGPPMPVAFYRSISDRDLAALIAYLREMPAVENVVPRSVYRIPLPAAYGPPVRGVPDVPHDDRLRYGAYLATIGHCLECHTPRTPQGPDEARAGAGGMSFPGPWGVSVSANITQDPVTGIGTWTDSQIRAAITRGVRPDGTRLLPPMAYNHYAAMTDEDIDALVAWTRTLKPVRNAIR